MTYLTHFHFDKAPFPSIVNNYFYGNKKQVRIMDDIVKQIRFFSGIYFIIGDEGVGKSLIVREVLKQLVHNDFCIAIKVGEKNDLLKSVGDVVCGKPKVQLDDVFSGLSKIYKRGQNIIILIDNAENLSNSDFIVLASLLSVAPYLRVILVGKKVVIKNIKKIKLKELGQRVIKVYRLGHIPTLGAVSYIRDISLKALSLSQYKRVVGLIPAFILAFFSNRNLENLNTLVTRSLALAFERGRSNVGIKDVFGALRDNLCIVRVNIYKKFQTIFVAILILFSLYFSGKIIFDRYNLIKIMEVQRSIDEQEKSFKI